MSISSGVSNSLFGSYHEYLNLAAMSTKVMPYETPTKEWMIPKILSNVFGRGLDTIRSEMRTKRLTTLPDLIRPTTTLK